MVVKAQPVLSDHHYQSALATASKEVDVRLAETIVGPDGVELFAAGRAFDDEVVAALRNKLFSAAELKLRVGDELDSSGLRRAFLKVLGEHADFRDIHVATKLETTLMVVIGRTQLSPKIREHLVVMRAVLPSLYAKTFLGAWLALALAKQLQLEKKEMDAVFRAALCRDLGMLYVRRSFLGEAAGSLRVTEREEIERHVQLSQRVAATLEGGGVEDVVKIVGNHHERDDRSGYPRRTKGSDLDLPSRILGLADVAVAIRFNEAGLTLEEVMLRLVLERKAYDPGVFETLRRLVSVHRETPEDELIFTRVETLMNRAKLLIEGAKEVESRLKWALQSSKKVPPSVVTRARRVIGVLRSSGLADKELAWWLKRVGAHREEATVEDLRELELQQIEMLHQLSRLEDELGGGGGDCLTATDVVKANVIG